ncbi:MAG: YtxH domain-containing protein [Minicystis sp.]
MNIIDWFEDVLPIKRKTSADWVLPALVGLGVGVAAGVGIGMLYAPDTGEEMRLRLREGAFRVKERAGELAERAKGQIASAAGQVASSAEQLQGRTS